MYTYVSRHFLTLLNQGSNSLLKWRKIESSILQIYALEDWQFIHNESLQKGNTYKQIYKLEIKWANNLQDWYDENINP